MLMAHSKRVVSAWPVPTTFDWRGERGEGGRKGGRRFYQPDASSPPNLGTLARDGPWLRPVEGGGVRSVDGCVRGPARRRHRGRPPPHALPSFPTHVQVLELRVHVELVAAAGGGHGGRGGGVGVFF
jgi:hypothetical protein